MVSSRWPESFSYHDFHQNDKKVGTKPWQWFLLDLLQTNKPPCPEFGGFCPLFEMLMHCWLWTLRRCSPILCFAFVSWVICFSDIPVITVLTRLHCLNNTVHFAYPDIFLLGVLPSFCRSVLVISSEDAAQSRYSISKLQEVHLGSGDILQVLPHETFKWQAWNQSVRKFGRLLRTEMIVLHLEKLWKFSQIHGRSLWSGERKHLWVFLHHKDLT